MNGYDRVARTINGESVEFLARTPILMRYAAEYNGGNYGTFTADYRFLVDSNLRAAMDFGIDQVSTISDPYRETSAFGAKLKFVPDGIPVCLKHPLEDDPDFTKLEKPDPETSYRLRDRLDALRLYQKKADGYSTLGWVEGPAAEAADLRGVTNFLMDLMDDETYAGELMDMIVDEAIRFAKAQIDIGCHVVGIGDAIASQVSPETYESLIQPREKRLVKAIHDMGGLVKIHICGNITHLLPGLADVGPDILDCDHMVDMALARKTMGPKAVLTGNLDPVSVVLKGTPASIRAAVRRAYESAGNPYFINAGCEVPSGTPPENLKALCEPVAYQK